MAQNAAVDRASIMREGYENLRDSAPNMTAQQQQLFEHKIKELELRQAWESNYTNASDAKKAVQQADQAEPEEDGIEYFIDE